MIRLQNLSRKEVHLENIREGQRMSATVIDIDNLQRALKLDLDCHSASIDPNSTTENLNSICDGHHHILKISNIYSDPIVVSIGPYHNGKHNLQVMETIKWHCLGYVLQANPNKTINDYLRVLRESYFLARSYYTGEVKVESGKFIQMLLLDGCFILVALCGIERSSYEHNSALEEDHSDQTGLWEYRFVKDDILLVTNQIPFFILEKIYELSTGEQNGSILSDKIASYVEKLLWEYPKSIKEYEKPKDFQNLLHLCHMYFKPSQLSSNQVIPDDQFGQLSIQWRQAIHYQVAGVGFEKKEYDSNQPHSLLDVRFSNNVIYVPCLPVDENTLSLFKNLIAFEQICPQFGNYFSAYIMFITHVVYDVKDVALFVQKGIIRNYFASDEDVLSIFRELDEIVVLGFVENHYLKSICNSLEAYYQSRMKWWTGGWLRQGIATIQNWV